MVMHLIRVGYRTINLEFLIEAVDSAQGAPAGEAPKGGIRVTIYPGKNFDVEGTAADQLRVHIEENLEAVPSKVVPRRDHKPRRKGRSAMPVDG